MKPETSPATPAVADETVTPAKTRSNSFFPAAVRVGYAPHVIVGKLRNYIAHT